MLTREEQIRALEEQFNTLVSKLPGDVYEYDADYGGVWAQQLHAVTEALTYLRTIIPNPQGKVDPVGPRRKLHL